MEEDDIHTIIERCEEKITSVLAEKNINEQRLVKEYETLIALKIEEIEKLMSIIQTKDLAHQETLVESMGELDKANQVISALKLELSKVKEEMEAKDTRIDALTVQISEHQDSLEEHKKSVGLRLKEVESYRAAVDSQDDEIKRLDAELSDKRKRISDLEDALHEKELAIADMQLSLQQKDKELSALSARVDAQSKKIVSTNELAIKSREEMELKIIDLEKTVETLKIKVDSIDKQKKEIEDARKSFEKDLLKAKAAQKRASITSGIRPDAPPAPSMVSLPSVETDSGLKQSASASAIPVTVDDGDKKKARHKSAGNKRKSVQYYSDLKPMTMDIISEKIKNLDVEDLRSTDTLAAALSEKVLVSDDGQRIYICVDVPNKKFKYYTKSKKWKTDRHITYLMELIKAPINALCGLYIEAEKRKDSPNNAVVTDLLQLIDALKSKDFVKTLESFLAPRIASQPN